MSSKLVKFGDTRSLKTAQPCGNAYRTAIEILDLGYKDAVIVATRRNECELVPIRRRPCLQCQIGRFDALSKEPRRVQFPFGSDL